MTEKEIIYVNVFKNIMFGLYRVEDIDLDATKENILDNFKDKYLNEIKKRLKFAGLKFIKLEYFSPQAYNFNDDSIDLTISITDKNKLKQSMLKHKEVIDIALSKNKSYDGYMALTVTNVEVELEKLNQTNYEPDVIVLKEILDLNCEEFEISEFFIYESLCRKCDHSVDSHCTSDGGQSISCE